MNERQFLEKFRQTPEGQRLLKTIRFAEGTAGPKGYQTMFGGGTFSDLSRHPDRVIRSGGYASAAAGAYQFLPGTWQSQASRLGLKGFGPAEQDVAALALARNRLMGIGGLSTLQKEGLSPRVAAALAPEWASFPTESGRSYYGQPVKSLSSLQNYYGNASVAPAAQQVAASAPRAATSPAPDSDIDIQALTTALRKKKSTSLLDSFKAGIVDQLLRQTVPGNLNFLGAPLFGSTGLF
jgi:muramidase (phage lysozyme)